MRRPAQFTVPGVVDGVPVLGVVPGSPGVVGVMPLVGPGVTPGFGVVSCVISPRMSMPPLGEARRSGDGSIVGLPPPVPSSSPPGHVA